MTEYELKCQFRFKVAELNRQKWLIDDQILALEQQETQRLELLKAYHKQRREDDDKIIYQPVKLVINGCATFEFTHQFEVEPTMQKYKPNGNGICQLFNHEDPNIIHQLSLSINGETIVRDFSLGAFNWIPSLNDHRAISINFDQRWFLYCMYYNDDKRMEFHTIKNEFNPHNIH